jgi:hypothetical protein
MKLSEGMTISVPDQGDVSINANNLIYAVSNTFSRHLKSLNATLTNSFMGLMGFVLVMIY